GRTEIHQKLRKGIAKHNGDGRERSRDFTAENLSVYWPRRGEVFFHGGISMEQSWWQGVYCCSHIHTSLPSICCNRDSSIEHNRCSMKQTVAASTNDGVVVRCREG
ncbi:unnamed protein product, partial [Ectocarpus sp. 8 AP-2014]